MESKFEVETAFGPVWMWGRDTGRPLVIVLNGAFAEIWTFDKVQRYVPDFDVVRLHHPGNHCPGLRPLNLGTTAAAYREAVESQFPGRRAIVVGSSTGALIALALRWPAVRRMVLVEPFLRTGHIWVFRLFSERVENAAQREFLWNVLGANEAKLENRDYSHLLASLAVPTHVLLGDIPLGTPRRFQEMPSLVDEQDRAALAASPWVTLVSLPGGHNITRPHAEPFVNAILQAAREAVDSE